ncbi:MAG: glycosyltransferase family 2 protein [Sphingomonadales bacterium]|nr:glycosyltransferase family 2 protein [Sphingomonadales bacterium]MBD3773079.1 glycosyltransferase family 2 protein [Paracoccaceae bacterium]
MNGDVAAQAAAPQAAADTAPGGAEDAPPSLTVVILTFNEILHIERAISGMSGLARRVVVVDSGSNDGTAEKAAELGAEVHTRKWVNYADQFQWALDNAAIDTDWTMRLDADEWFGPELVDNLKQALRDADDEVTAISIDRQHHFLGRWIRHGGRYPLTLLRLWRTGLGRIEQRWMDEHIVVESGRMIHIDGTFVDDNRNDLTFFTAKHNGYATREAVDALIDKYDLFDPVEDRGLASTGQAKQKRKAKLDFYNRLPLGVGPLGYFLYRYIVQLGFLDGKPGLVYHFLQGFWYRFLVDAKRYEFERGLADAVGKDEMIDRLTALSGHDLRAFDADARRRAAP